LNWTEKKKTFKGRSARWGTKTNKKGKKVPIFPQKKKKKRRRRRAQR